MMAAGKPAHIVLLSQSNQLAGADRGGSAPVTPPAAPAQPASVRRRQRLRSSNLGHGLPPRRLVSHRINSLSVTESSASLFVQSQDAFTVLASSGAFLCGTPLAEPLFF